jgi:hypothetical protein
MYKVTALKRLCGMYNYQDRKFKATDFLHSAERRVKIDSVVIVEKNNSFEMVAIASIVLYRIMRILFYFVKLSISKIEDTRFLIICKF